MAERLDVLTTRDVLIDWVINLLCLLTSAYEASRPLHLTGCCATGLLLLFLLLFRIQNQSEKSVFANKVFICFNVKLYNVLNAWCTNQQFVGLGGNVFASRLSVRRFESTWLRSNFPENLKFWASIGRDVRLWIPIFRIFKNITSGGIVIRAQFTGNPSYTMVPICMNLDLWSTLRNLCPHFRWNKVILLVPSLNRILIMYFH